MLTVALTRGLEDGEPVRPKQQKCGPALDHHLVPDLHILVIDDRVGYTVTNDCIAYSVCFFFVLELGGVAA